MAPSLTTPSSTTPSPTTPSPGARWDSSDLSLPESGWDLHIGRGSRAEATGWRPALEVHTDDGLIDVAVAGGLDQTLLRGALRGRRAGRHRGLWGTARHSGGWALAWGHLPTGPTPEPDPGNATGGTPGRGAGGDAGNAPGSDLRHPEVRDPEIREPEIREPEIREPEIREPEIREPEIREPEVREPEVIVEFRTRRTTYRVRATALAGAFWVAEAPGGFRSVAVITGPRRAAARLRRYRPGH